MNHHETQCILNIKFCQEVIFCNVRNSRNIQELCCNDCNVFIIPLQQHPASSNTPALTIPGIPKHPEAGSEAREMGCLRLRSRRRFQRVSAGLNGKHGRTMPWGTGRMGIWVGNCSNQQEFPELKNEHVMYNCTTVKENEK